MSPSRCLVFRDLTLRSKALALSRSRSLPDRLNFAASSSLSVARQDWGILPNLTTTGLGEAVKVYINVLISLHLL